METTTNWDAYFPMPNDRNRERLLWLAEKNGLDYEHIEKFNRFIDSFEDDLLMWITMVDKIRGFSGNTSIKLIIRWHPTKDYGEIITTIHKDGSISSAYKKFQSLGYQSIPEILAERYIDYINQLKRYLIYG